MIQVEQYGPVIAIRMARRFLGKPLYWSTAYWVDGLLIDTGPAATARELVRVLDQVKVAQIAITHGHEDHIGGLAALRRRYPEIPVYATARTQGLLEDPTRLKMHLYRRIVWGTPEPVGQVTTLEEIEDVIHTPRFSIRAVETPGHSADHVCYFEPQYRWLFSGDAFIGGRDRTWAREHDLFGVIGSLQTLATLQPDRLFPGSGNVRRVPINDILDKVNYLSQLARDVARLQDEGKSKATIAAELFPADANMSFWTQQHFTAINLVEACCAYNELVGVTRRPGAPEIDLGISTTHRSGEPPEKKKTKRNS
jgi:glyoxylase-like metal-dependent hydrolase (beta-lactamase superfamily II)